MAWAHDSLTPVDSLLFCGELTKVGHFQCTVDDPCFPVTDSLDNDVFAFLQSSLWIRRGVGDYQFAEAGSVLLHRAGSVIERRCANDDGDKTYWFGVHPEIFLETLQRHALSADKMGIALIAEPRLRYRIASLARRIEYSCPDRLQTEEAILALFFDLCERLAGHVHESNCTRMATVIRRRRLTDKVRAYMDEHLCENFDLETVAHATATSVYHLCRVFKEQTGLTLHAYRMQQRLGRVLDRLIDGEAASLSVLANQFGFSSHSHLCREFSRQMGRPPSAHRLSKQPL